MAHVALIESRNRHNTHTLNTTREPRFSLLHTHAYTISHPQLRDTFFVRIESTAGRDQSSRAEL